MTLNEMFEIDVKRALKWHPDGLDSWSPLEWAGAMCGEAGEAANAAKKLKRLQNSICSLNSIEENRHYTTILQAQEHTAKEVADTILYGLILMAAIGVTDPEKVLRQVFNQKSEEYGFPERFE